MKNNLIAFDLPDLIFVDANIFVDHAAANQGYGKSCETFLEDFEKPYQSYPQILNIWGSYIHKNENFC
ncbi:MAG: hypothetical protein JW945_00925, partial [Methanomicrobia archaeon]|nr:hypothetical protein [Methanomicrobia archaeon]